MAKNERPGLTPMELYQTLSREELTALAKRVGKARTTLYQILTGRRGGSLKTLQAITDATGGRVEFIKRTQR